jgi:hypothetical protein
MNHPDSLVRQILDYIEPRIDLAHVARAHAHHRAALDYVDTDRAPIIFYLPYESEQFTPYPHAEAFADPAKMLVNELLIGFTSIYHAVDLRDDAPYCLRPNLGIGIISSQFGAEIRLVEDNPPWVMPLGDVEKLRTLADEPMPDVHSGLVPRALEQYDYFTDAVKDYPKCRAAFQFTMPDLQGPFSIAELLFGSAIYPLFYDDPELVRRWLTRITEQIIAVHRVLVTQTKNDLGDGYCYQHAVAVKGNILIRDDSMVNLSSKMYRDVVLPFDQQLGKELGCVAVHFCGHGSHQVGNLLQIPNLGSLDLGNPEMNDLDALYVQAQPQRVALLRLRTSVNELNAVKIKTRFPRGVILAHTPTSVNKAHALLEQYEN